MKELFIPITGIPFFLKRPVNQCRLGDTLLFLQILSMHKMIMKLRGGKHYGKLKQISKFQEKPIYIFYEIKHHHLLYLKIRALNGSNFWFREVFK